MSKVTYIKSGGEQHVVNVQPGLSLMEGAVQNGVPGLPLFAAAPVPAPPAISISMRRGGAERRQERLEESMLEMADDVQPNSRLAVRSR